MNEQVEKMDKKRPTSFQTTGSRWKRRFGKPQGLLLQVSAPSTCHIDQRGGDSVTAPVSRDMTAGVSEPEQSFGLRSTLRQPGTAHYEPESVVHVEQRLPQGDQLDSERSQELPSTSYEAWQVSDIDKSKPCTPFGNPGAAPAAAFCPVCGLYLQDIADNTPQQIAHISSCSDRQEEQISDSFFDAVSEGEGGQEQCRDGNTVVGCADWVDAEEASDAYVDAFCELDSAEPEEIYVDLSDDGSNSWQADAPDTSRHGSSDMGLNIDAPSSSAVTEHLGALKQQLSETASLAEEVDIATWLAALGYDQYVDAFRRAELRVSVVALLTDEDLQELSVTALGHRRRILAAAEQVAKGAEAGILDRAAGEAEVSKQQPILPERPAGLRSVAEALGMRMQRPMLAGSGQASMASKLGHKRCITDFFASRSRLPGSARRQISQPVGVRVQVPEWHRVPGTSFVIDKFGRQFENSVSCCSWFLTHFHADHYGGLSGRFKSGVVYCTRITAKLVNQRLNVSWSQLKVVELRTPITVEGVRVTYLEANHCPGAAMILFEVPGKRPLLHTGDCRCHPGMQAEPVLQRLVGQADLVMDTTYCNPQYDFPPQREVLRFVVDAVRAEEFNSSTLFLFGSYTIGKERLFLEAACILQQKVYVSRAKRKVLEALDLPPEYRCLLTENDREAQIQAVPLAFVNMKRMAHIAKHYRSRFTTIVGFQPTGWTHSAERGKASRGRRHQKGSLILYQVPYSEHSSFREMREFVQWLQPRRIIPSVGNDRGNKARKMVSLLRD